MARHLADAYRLGCRAWDSNASEQDRYDLRGFPEPLTCTYQNKEIASVNEDGEIDMLVGTLSQEQAREFVMFVGRVYAPPDCHSIVACSRLEDGPARADHGQRPTVGESA